MINRLQEITDITQLVDENYCYNGKSDITQIKTLGYCDTCGKRITTGEEVYETKNGCFCEESCEIELLKLERESMLSKRAGLVLNSMWIDLQEQGAINISAFKGILSVQMDNMDEVEDCKFSEKFTPDYDEVYKNIGGVRFFALTKREVQA